MYSRAGVTFQKSTLQILDMDTLHAWSDLISIFCGCFLQLFLLSFPHLDVMPCLAEVLLVRRVDSQG